jgi:hypothetical protein
VAAQGTILRFWSERSYSCGRAAENLEILEWKEAKLERKILRFWNEKKRNLRLCSGELWDFGTKRS